MKYLWTLLFLTNIAHAEVSFENKFHFKDCVKLERTNFFQKYCGKMGILEIASLHKPNGYPSYYYGTFINNNDISCNYNESFTEYDRVTLIKCPIGMPFEM
jgi:hypothetical protein